MFSVVYFQCVGGSYVQCVGESYVQCGLLVFDLLAEGLWPCISRPKQNHSRQRHNINQQEEPARCLIHVDTKLSLLLHTAAGSFERMMGVCGWS